MKVLRRGCKQWLLIVVSSILLLFLLHKTPFVTLPPFLIADAVRNAHQQLPWPGQWRDDVAKADVPRLAQPIDRIAPGDDDSLVGANASGDILLVNFSHSLASHAFQAVRNDQAIDQVRKVKNVSFDICRKADFTKRMSRPMIALASVPGSGNTWVRYLLERASGVLTGSVYRDKHLLAGGFRGEFANPAMRNTLVIKTHDTGSAKSTAHYQGAIVIVRNPYNTLLSYANLINAGHTGWATETYFKSEKWDKFIQSASISWEDRITSWLPRNNVRVLFYEDLKSDLRNQIIQLLRFLDFPVDHDRLDCMEAHPEGDFHRKAKYLGGNDPTTFDLFSDRHREIIDEHVKRASDALRKYGFIDHDLSYAGLER
ncbi:WSCD family member AAEL009094-like [Diadema antillarum]|uniref:WSCD family member AAEL009094-like n=1 Tax=Diadema antillarum TaxID=105358 RepID=UPI003A869425